MEKYLDHQYHPTGVKVPEDLKTPEKWTFADIAEVSKMIQENHDDIEATLAKMPLFDESILDLERSVKKSKFACGLI